MNFEDFYNDRLAGDLEYLLAKRLRLNKTWNQVNLDTNKKKLIVRWFDPKVVYEDSSMVFQEHSVPFTLDRVQAEIKRQFEKLQEDESA